jgi:bacterioferritin-associated ferredoxin
VIICHCNVVSDRVVRTEIAKGADTADQVADACGAGAHCGSCRPTILTLLATTALPERSQPAA